MIGSGERRPGVPLDCGRCNLENILVFAGFFLKYSFYLCRRVFVYYYKLNFKGVISV